jgi:colanic acid/amylovoran biosynthesis protein
MRDHTPTHRASRGTGRPPTAPSSVKLQGRMPLRVDISSTVALNGGDAAILFALKEAIGRQCPDATIAAHDLRPAVAARYYPDLTWRPQLASFVAPSVRALRHPAVRPRLELLRTANLFGRMTADTARKTAFDRAVDDYRMADVVVNTGGTYLVEKYNQRPRLFEYEALMRLGIPTVFYTQSVGKFTDTALRTRLRSVLSASPLIALRDQRSAENVLDLGVPSDRIMVGGDAVFAFAPQDVSFEGARGHKRLRIAVSVRHWEDGGRGVAGYVQAMARGLEAVIDAHDAEVTFVSTCQGIAEYGLDDSAIAVQVAAAMSDEHRARVTVSRDFRSPVDFREFLRTFDLMVGTRMHAGILALTAGVPVLPIAYEFKTVELFERFGLGDLVLDYDSLTGSRLSDGVDRIVRELRAVRAQLTSGVREETQRAHAVEIRLGHVLQGAT